MGAAKSMQQQSPGIAGMLSAARPAAPPATGGLAGPVAPPPDPRMRWKGQGMVPGRPPQQSGWGSAPQQGMVHTPSPFPLKPGWGQGLPNVPSQMNSGPAVQKPFSQTAGGKAGQRKF